MCHFSEARLRSPTSQVIYVKENLNLEQAEGARLTEDLVIGAQIAGGAQVLLSQTSFDLTSMIVWLCACSMHQRKII